MTFEPPIKNHFECKSALKLRQKQFNILNGEFKILNI